MKISFLLLIASLWAGTANAGLYPPDRQTNAMVWKIAGTNTVVLSGSSKDGTYTNAGLISVTSDPPQSYYRSGNKFLYHDVIGNEFGVDTWASFTDMNDFTNNGTSYFYGTLGGSWTVGGLGGVVPSLSYYGSPALTANGLIIGDASGLTNFPPSLSAQYIGSSNGNGTNTSFYAVGSGASDAGKTVLKITKDPNDIFEAQFVSIGNFVTNDIMVQFGPELGNANFAKMRWWPTHSLANGSKGGEFVLFAPRISLAIASEVINSGGIGAAGINAGRTLQVGYGQNNAAIVEFYSCSRGDKVISSNAFSIPIYFSVVSSNGTEVDPAISGYNQTADGGAGKSGLRLWYNSHMDQLAAESGISGYNFNNYDSTFPAADLVWQGGSNSKGTATFYGSLVSTQFVGNGAGLTNIPSSEVGVTDASSATAGNVGEQLTQSRLRSAAVAAITATPTNVTASVLSLTAGCWDVAAVVGFNPAASTTVTRLDAAISTTSGTLPGTDTIGVPDANGQVRAVFDQAASVAGGDITLQAVRARVNISTTTSYYLVAQSAFGISTLTVYGSISATRVR